MAKNITFEIDNEGNVTITGENFTGNTCEAAMKEYLEQLGTVQSTKAKPQAALVKQQQHLKV